MIRSWMLALLVASHVHRAHRYNTPQLCGDSLPSVMLLSCQRIASVSMENSVITLSCSFPHCHDVCMSSGIRMLSTKSRSSSSSWQWFKPLVTYAQSLRWTPIPLGLGFAIIAYQQFRHVKKRESRKLSADDKPIIATDIEVSMYKMLPLRITSRFWGWANSFDLPVSLRSPILKQFIYKFGCDITEASVQDLKFYKNLGEFFRRELKPGLRPVDIGNCMVSPADGTVVHFGPVERGFVEQVKGVSYSLRSFLGPISWNNEANHETGKEYYKQLVSHKDKCLYQFVVYLAPGDYHRFHSPIDWNITFRRHFPGELLSVRPGYMSWIPELLTMNERVVYVGQWKYGFCAMAAVGATNVGSIKVYFDEELCTNKKRWRKGSHEDSYFNKVSMAKSSPFGEFNFGSTVVLLFEGPKDMKFNVKPGQKIKYGQRLTQYLDS